MLCIRRLASCTARWFLPKVPSAVASCSAGWGEVAGSGHSGGNTSAHARRYVMIALGIILLVVGFLTGISILWTLGIILAVVGAVFWLMGSMGHAVAGRRHYW